ncbi:hypothetical protein CLV62_101146 [Dysgonomonas alginatilytica]|uniref:Uncharacterized protein n=1 Tax=Dysgonomonas alginatilytica TaxID=1605892 RepID=A0A2V3PT63_9BACT|nr:hypothetical protein [Dysgonomonas alginatilytica]PXV68880.1 hypothetical protein CLV62_101146 [Dysgonomonas alginatilytica]
MEEEKKNGITFKFIWNIIMFVIYLGIAYLIAFTPMLLPYNYRANDSHDDFVIPRIVLGVGVAVYALFRGYRLLKERNFK